MEKLFLIDAYALIFKFYYAFIGRPMRNREGLNTSAIYGFTKFINEIVTRECPQHLGVAFDPKGGNFRHKLYPDYKANRDATPEDIILSTPHIKRILEAMKIPILEVAGYEADDVIGTISNKAACNGFEVYMVTPDKDYGQLIRDCVYMYKPGKSGSGVEIVGKEQLKDIYGIDNPCYIIDILALWGDVADNIPGVPGIGEKTAAKLVNEFGTVEAIIASADKLKGKQRENILANIEQLKLAKRLTTICLDVPIEFEPEKLIMETPNFEELRKIYVEMGFSSLLKDLDMWQHDRNTCKDVIDNVSSAVVNPDTVRANVETQLSLFDIPGGTESMPESKYRTASDIPHNYIIIKDVAGVSQLAATLAMQSEFCFDTETTALDTITARLVGLSVAIEPHKAYYIPFSSSDIGAAKALLEPLRAVFENKMIAKIGQNLKFDIMMLASYGIDVEGTLLDTMIMHYLINSDSRHGMDYLAQEYLGYSTIKIESLIGSGARQTTMDTVALDIIAEYAAEDADITLQLKEKLWEELKSKALVDLYLKVEEPLIRVLADMERAGVAIDTVSLAEYRNELAEELINLEQSIKDLAGIDEQSNINVNSSRQIGEILFEKLKIDPKPKMTKTKQYRTDEEYLVSLRHTHPVIDVILEYRGVKKLLSTYVETLPGLINPVTGRIHTTYNQTVTSTGRLSSNNPNLQNIPIRDERGKRIRAAFIAESDDTVLLSADYSQIELRIMAHLSGDKAMIEAFSHGEDIHAATAAKIFGVPLEKVTSDQRRKAKTANFGIIYGISAFGLSQRLDISRTEAKELIDGYFATYPGIKEYMERTIDVARKNGYVETIFARRKALIDINSSNSLVRSYAERNAINAPIQGAAADIIKIAMACVRKSLREGKYRSKLILQVHDELVLEVHKDELEVVEALVKRCMETAVTLSVPLPADAGYGKNWLQAH